MNDTTKKALPSIANPSNGALINSIKLVKGFRYTKYSYAPSKSGVHIIGVIKKLSCITVPIICWMSRNLAQKNPRVTLRQKIFTAKNNRLAISHKKFVRSVIVESGITKIRIGNRCRKKSASEKVCWKEIAESGIFFLLSMASAAMNVLQDSETTWDINIQVENPAISQGKYSKMFIFQSLEYTNPSPIKNTADDIVIQNGPRIEPRY